MRWVEFEQACPELARIGGERLRARELCMLGTIRRDGTPRISPNEVDFAEGELFLGMMWQSRKARDLLRDPRCTLHNCLTDRHDSDGDFKLIGRAVDVHDAELRAIYRRTIFERIGWEPTEPNFHLFAFDIESAAFVNFGDEAIGMAWNPRRGLWSWDVPNE